VDFSGEAHGRFVEFEVVLVVAVGSQRARSLDLIGFRRRPRLTVELHQFYFVAARTGRTSAWHVVNLTGMARR
jgi:hypothetical protein